MITSKCPQFLCVRETERNEDNNMRERDRVIFFEVTWLWYGGSYKWFIDLSRYDFKLSCVNKNKEMLP